MPSTGRVRQIRRLNGGSHAVTALVKRDGELFVRKQARGEHATKLATQHNWLVRHGDLPFIPKVLRGGWCGNSFTLDIEYCAGFESLRDVLERATPAEGAAVLQQLLAVLYDRLYSVSETVTSGALVESYIRKKLCRKIELSARMHPALRHLSEQKRLLINGVPYAGLPVLVDRLQSSPTIMRELGCFERSVVHGDLTLENILYRGGSFKLIDPNGDNLISDMTIDVAKLYQSIHSGYETLCALRTVVVERDALYFASDTLPIYTLLHRNLDAHMQRTLPAHRYRSLLFHEAVHYIRLLPYRIESNPATAPAFLGTAVRLLSDFLAQFEPAHNVRRRDA